MKNKMKWTGIILAAAMLLSGCDTDKPADTGVTEEPAQVSEAPDTAKITPGEPHEPDNAVPFEYSVGVDGDVTVRKFFVQEVVVPETVNGTPVTSVNAATILKGIEAKKLTINAKIETLNALGMFESLTEITLPDTIKDIKPTLFVNCKSLKAVNIVPGGDYCSVDGVVYTSDMKTLVYVPRAVYGKFVVPETVENIGEDACRYCKISEVELPKSLKTIGKSAFREQQLTTLDIPASVTEIGGYAFRDNAKLETLTLHDGLTTLGELVFDGTAIKELYLPDTVTECGKYFVGNLRVPISAPYALYDANSDLRDSRYVTFRGETMLDTAVRQALAMNLRDIVFIDLDFDGFPELIRTGSSKYDMYVYKFGDKDGWEYYGTWDNEIRDDPLTEHSKWLNQVEAEEKAKSEDSPYYDTKKYLDEIELWQANDTGEKIFRFGKYFATETGGFGSPRYSRDDCTLLATFDLDGVKERYKPVGEFVIFDSEFLSEPGGEVQKTIVTDDFTVDTYPYVINNIPERQKVLINGADLLHGGTYEGVSFDWYNGTLTLDNAVIEGDSGISFVNLETRPTIELIGSSRVYAGGEPSLTCSQDVYIRGEGTLDIGTTDLYDKASSSMKDAFMTLYISCEATVREAVPGAFINNRANITLNENARLICGTEDAPGKGLAVSTLKAMGDSRVDIVSDGNGIQHPTDYYGDMNIYAEDNAKLNITAKRYGMIDDYGNDGYLYVYDSAEVNVKAGIDGVSLGVASSFSNVSGVTMRGDDCKLNVTAEGICITTDYITIIGGTLEVHRTGSGTRALGVKGVITDDGELISQTGSWGDENTPDLKIVVKEKEPDPEEYYYGDGDAKAKPVIYLYPEEQTDVSVKISFPLGGEFTCTYPDYGDGWNVTALPDGTMYDADGNEYYCLYWEGVGYDTMTGSEGFCVAGADTAAFLREKLTYIGLTAREANEFIIYWLPRMQDNPYNIIRLYTDSYAESVPLDVSPAPDTQIRVFMKFTPSDSFVRLPEQELPHYERNGFTLVEWGGSES